MEERFSQLGFVGIIIIIILVSYLYKLIKSNQEKKILSDYFHNDRTFFSGYSRTEALINNNLEAGYYFKREEEQLFKVIYERIILFIMNLYLYPNHKIEKRYMKSEDLYIMFYIYNYFKEIVDNKRDDELKYYMKKDDYGGITYEFNDVGAVAMKVYLASAKYLNKNGIIPDYEVENVKNYIQDGMIKYQYVRW